MRIHCEINLRKQTNGLFLTGSIVTGTTRYVLDDDIVFNKITISLSGRGNLAVQNMRKKDDTDGLITDEESYVSEDIIVLNDERGHVLPIGSYDTQFCFQLPLNIPPSLNYVKTNNNYTLRCRIGYYLKIEFEGPEGIKRFKTEINVSPGVNPTSYSEPKIYDKQRKLIQLLRNSFVTLKATINTPVVAPGGKAELTYEVFNDTNVNFKSVESKLIEETYLPRGQYDATFSNEVVTDIKPAGVRSGESQTIDVTVPIPRDVNSIENSKLIARNYFVKITVYLPLPYRNVSLKVPVQIGDVIEERTPVESRERRSSSWEVLEEDDGSVYDEQEETESENSTFYK
ncbi:uncharacterized protein [Choristoneura fumiferana]|uniref:uncharacterized protein n=1 Tax=Choristoneura fumiferana TaxID=7141 RepID=UPI003D15BA43